MATHFRRNSREVDDLVMATLREARRGLTAYEVMAKLEERQRRIAPTQTYRSLGRLIEQGGVLRIESLNSYYGLKGIGSNTVMLFCRSCRTTVEVECPEVSERLHDIAKKNSVRLVRAIAEVGGICAACQTSKVTEAD